MRSETRKRPPLMTPQRWIFVSVATVLLLVTFSAMYYKEIKAERWTEERAAIAEAIDAGELSETSDVYKHIWDQVSWIVKGTTTDDEELYVWLPQAEGSEPIVVKASESASEKSVRAKFELSKPDAKVKRIQPGLFNGAPVWEIFYKQTTDQSHYYYSFYSFTTGEFINEYTLPAKTES